MLKVTCEDKVKYFLVPTQASGSLLFRTIYFSISAVLRNFLPIIITAVSTALLVKFIQKKKRIRRDMLSVSVTVEQRVREDQLNDLTICLIALAVAFVVFIAPITLLSILFYANVTNCIFYKAIRWAGCFSLLNSSTNFIIYCWKMPLFRKATARLVCPGGGKEEGKQKQKTVQFIS